MKIVVAKWVGYLAEQQNASFNGPRVACSLILILLLLILLLRLALVRN